MDQKQRRLKRIVVGLGVLLVICFCIVVGTIAYRLSKASGEEAAEAAISAPTAAPIVAQVSDVLAALDVALPMGARVIGVTSDGSNYLVLLDTGSGQQVLVIKKSDGKAVQTIRFSQPD